ncbi:MULTISPECIES: GNAT family N-acetyltransferase [unclassified Roseovarius]|uniref:GNAT family N-acetyltransferase n=1 Tax=unclassified Roseovarius TaxID=2614913 RepID=UPI00006858E6|nr:MULTISPECIES: GNAT family N-acetyltransferase [unclassified Roseovarius]EAQ26716.1 acetyltransferase, GNAT family protein [Roseovarius sp. 217]KJS45380.1 MAG: acetyltransferase [Roseovarius sp. BRH_c41]
MKDETILNQPVIAAERFDLRPLRGSDAGLIGLNAGDERVARFTRSIPHPLPPGATEAMIERARAEDRSEDIWAIDGTKAGGSEVMGLISLERVDDGQSEIAYWVAPAYWNTGVASAAVEVLLAANPHHARTIFASVFQDNAASARVLTNCGFQYLGDAEAFSVARGSKVLTWTYSKKMI